LLAHSVLLTVPLNHHALPQWRENCLNFRMLAI